MLSPVVREASYRTATEDRVLARSHMGEWLLAVADGAGGRPGGAEAAQFAIERVRMAPRWEALIEEIDQELARTYEPGETTLTIVNLEENQLQGSSVGHSEAWLIGAIGPARRLTENQRRKPGVGTGGAMAIPFQEKRPQGTLLLATDGLFKYASEDEIVSTVQGAACLEEAADALVALARGSNGKLYDDLALILLAL